MSVLKIQYCINSLAKSLLTFPKVLLWSKLWLNFKSNSDKSECVILGNGPSLQESLKNGKEFLQGKDLFCVNYFPKSELYHELKPKYYVNTSPSIWETNVKEKYKKGHIDNLKNMSEITDWDLELFIPSQSSKYSDWKKDIKKNKKLKIRYFNKTPIEGFDWFKNLMFKANLGGPRPHNVMISAIMVALSLGYKKIYLLGADHSWLNDISVDDENYVFFDQNHFYKEKQHVEKRVSDYQKDSKPKKLHEFLMQFVYTFEGYHIIQDYANKRGVEILNATPNSFVDAFKRVDI